MCLVCPIPSTYVGMPSPALGPAVLCWGNDVVSLPPHNILRPDLAVWPWHTSSIWPLSRVPNVQLYSTVCKQLTSVNASHQVLEVCIRRYASLSMSIDHINAHLEGLEQMTVQGGDWSDAECIFCFGLLTCKPFGMTGCSHVFHHSCWSTYCQVGCGL